MPGAPPRCMKLYRNPLDCRVVPRSAQSGGLWYSFRTAGHPLTARDSWKPAIAKHPCGKNLCIACRDPARVASCNMPRVVTPLTQSGQAPDSFALYPAAGLLGGSYWG